MRARLTTPPETTMKLLAVGAVCALAASLSGCGTTSRDALAQAVAAKIPYCSGHIQIAAGIGGIAGTGTGLTNNGQLDCPGKPYETAPATPAVVVGSPIAGQ